MFELLTSQAQPASWVCFYWYGCRVADLRSCLKQELNTRKLPADITYFWLSPFAHRPHAGNVDTKALDNIPKETTASKSIPADPGYDPNVRERPNVPITTFGPQAGAASEAASYHKALTASKSKMLMVLDKKEDLMGPALTFKRLWCVYEMITCFNHAGPNFTLDIGIIDDNQRAAIITMGLTQEEQEIDLANAKDEKNAAAGWKAKADREKALDYIYVEKALATKVEAATTVAAADRTRLLNLIAEQPVNQAPLEKHAKYKEANDRIISRCMLVFWRRVMSGASADNDILKLQTSLVDAIRNDQSLTYLDLSLAFMVPGGDEKLPLLTRCFPQSLKILKLDLRELGLMNDSLKVLMDGLPRDLEELKLDLGRNDQIDNFGIEAMLNRLPPKVVQLRLVLEGTGVSPEMQAKRESLDGLKQFIQEENEKGNTCIMYSLIPSKDQNGKGRMIPQTTKCKVFPPEK
jgi:hypothetical protein